MNIVNKIVFAKKDFKEDDLYKKISMQIQLLIETNNICTVSSVKIGNDFFIVIEYSAANPQLFQPYPYFLYPDEASHVSLFIAKKSLAQYETEIDTLSDSIEQIESANEQVSDSDVSNKKKRGGKRD